MAAAALSPAIARAQDSSVPTRQFGNKDVQVSMLALGGHHIGRISDDQESIRLIRQAIDHGVTFLDNAWEYHDGRSEELMGRALEEGYREKAFLMTKHHGREKKTAMQHLEDSLRRLKTDHIDLWQFHEVVYDADPDLIFAPGGGIEAAEEAKQQGKVRFIGFTGHKDPNIFLKMLAHKYEWDAVQMPVNPFDPHYRSFITNILPILVERGIAPIAMKSCGSKHILDTGIVSAEECLRYAWSQPVCTIVSGMENFDLLEQNIQLAKTFDPMDAQGQEQLIARTKDLASDGKHEPFKSTNAYDGAVGRKIHGVA
jgi:predicted aldo/keto reductase-like oxidoreductase